MGEIKSTLDLIMEKTKHLSLNNEEKEIYKQKELDQKVRAAAIRFFNKERNADFLIRELGLLPEKNRQEGKKICLDLFMERLSPFEDNERILTGAAKLLDKAEYEQWQEVVSDIKNLYISKAEQAKKEVENQARGILASAGIQGPAVVPNTGDDSPFWKEEKEKIVKAFQDSIKKALTIL